MSGRNSAAALHEGAEDTASEAHGGPPSGFEVPPFQAIYARYFDFVWSSARRLGVKPAAMDDVVQEIFLVIHGKVHTLQQPESLRSWIYGIVRRTVSGYRRSQRTRDTSDAALARHTKAHEEKQPTPLELTEHNEETKLLWELLGELEATKREVLVLVEIEGMTAPEIADTLDIPLNTVYSRLRTARLAFEAALSRRVARETIRGLK